MNLNLTNKKKSHLTYGLYILSLTLIVVTFIVVVCGALIIPSIGTLSTPIPTQFQPYFDGMTKTAIPTRTGIGDINFNSANAIFQLSQYAGADPVVVQGIYFSNFSYSLTNLGITTVVLFGATVVTSICSFAAFYLLKVKFHRHQIVTLVISFALMAAAVITFLLLKLNATNAAERPYRYVSLYQGNEKEAASGGAYTDGQIQTTSFGSVCTVYSTLIGIVIGGLITMTNYDIIKTFVLSHNPNHPKYSKKK